MSPGELAGHRLRNRAIPAATYVHAPPGTSLGRDDLAEGRLYFSGLFVLHHPLIAGLATVRSEHGAGRSPPGVRRLVTQRGDSRRPVARKPAVRCGERSVATAAGRAQNRLFCLRQRAVFAGEPSLKASCPARGCSTTARNSGHVGFPGSPAANCSVVSTSQGSEDDGIADGGANECCGCHSCPAVPAVQCEAVGDDSEVQAAAGCDPRPYGLAPD